MKLRSPRFKRRNYHGPRLETRIDREIRKANTLAKRMKALNEIMVTL